MGATEIYLSRPWLAHYGKGVPAAVEVPLKSVPQAFDEATAMAPGNTAVGFYGRPISFRELREAADRPANAPAGPRAKNGEPAAPLLGTTPPFTTGFFSP